jgi:thiol-disulfide isomerase/thioredoxin
MVRSLAAMFVALLILPLASCSSSPTNAQEKEDKTGDDVDIQAAKAREEYIGDLKKFLNAKGDAVAKEAADVPKAVQRFLGKTKKDEEQFELAMVSVQILESKGQSEVALKVLADLKAHYADADKTLAKAVAKAHEMAEKRLGLIGKPLKLEGKLLGGADFDWSKYKGKVVLVDFWATWCPPCRAELPNVKENYEKYHGKGFEVIGVSLDKEQGELEDFIKSQKLPWANLFPEKPEDRFWSHPLVEKFGIEGIPFTVLVNREGKVVALNVRGEGLGEELEKALGEKAAKK